MIWQNEHMSIESELNDFKYLALEQQIKIPYYQRKNRSLSIIPEILDPILDEIVQNNPVVATGEVYMPVLNDRGYVIGSERADTTKRPVIGGNQGVHTGRRSDISENLSSQVVVGYWISVNGIRRRSLLEHTKSDLFAFAPVESSQLHVPDLILPGHLIKPESDDEIATEIDQSIQGDPNIDQLVKVFNSLQDASSMKIEFYLNYLNSVFPLQNHITKQVICDSLMQAEEDGNYTNTLNASDAFIGRLPLVGFAYIDILDGLCVVADMNEEQPGTERLYIPVNSISKLDVEPIES